MSLCVLAGGKAVTIAATLFTLSWTHSVEKIRWEEDWQVTAAGLEIIEARVQGSGAGMEPPAEARFNNGWWSYKPALGPLPELNLAASGATGEGWRLCTGNSGNSGGAKGDARGGSGDQCTTLGARKEAPVILRPCD